MRNRSNDSNYHWDYQDYRGNYGQSPARARKSSGLKYFLIAMGVVILLVGALCVGASVWGSKPAPQPDQDSSIGNELEHLPEIDQQNKPEDNVPDTTEDGLLTPAGIYKSAPPRWWASSPTAAAPPRRAAASSFRKTATSSPMPMWSAAAKSSRSFCKMAIAMMPPSLGRITRATWLCLKCRTRPRAGRGYLRQQR